MKKEQTTVRLEPLLKIILVELSRKQNHGNLNNLIVKILSDYAFKKQEEEKIEAKLIAIESKVNSIDEQLDSIFQVLEVIVQK